MYLKDYQVLRRLKNHLHYKMITSQDVSSELQVKNFFNFIQKLCFVLKIFKFLYKASIHETGCIFEYSMLVIISRTTKSYQSQTCFNNMLRIYLIWNLYNILNFNHYILVRKAQMYIRFENLVN